MPGTSGGGRLDRIEAEIRALQQQAQLTQRAVQHWQSHDAADASYAILAPLSSRPAWATPQTLDAALFTVLLAVVLGAGLLRRQGWHRLRIRLAMPGRRRAPQPVAPSDLGSAAAQPVMVPVSPRAAVVLAPPPAQVDRASARAPQPAPRATPATPSVRAFGAARVGASLPGAPASKQAAARCLAPVPAAALPPVPAAAAPTDVVPVAPPGSRSPGASPSFSFDSQAAATEVMRVRKSLADKRDARLQPAGGEEERPMTAVAKLADPAPPLAPVPRVSDASELPSPPAAAGDVEIKARIEARPSPALEAVPPGASALAEGHERDYAVTMELAEASAALSLWTEARELAYEVLEDGSGPLRKRARSLLQQLLGDEPLRVTS